MKCNVNGSIYRAAEEVVWKKLVRDALFVWLLEEEKRRKTQFGHICM